MSKKPVCYIIRARFQPCLRQHYYAIKQLIFDRKNEFTVDVLEVSQKASIMLLVISDVTREVPAAPKESDAGNLRFWRAFNPLSASETIQQLEMALWGYLDEDPSLSDADYDFLKQVFIYSVFPISCPLRVQEVIRVMTKREKPFLSKASNNWITPRTVSRLKDYVEQLFSHINLEDGTHHACWTFPLLDRSDIEDADHIIENLNRWYSIKPSQERQPCIMIGLFEEDVAIGAECSGLVHTNTRRRYFLGGYGSVIFEKLARINEHLDLTVLFKPRDIAVAEDQWDRDRLNAELLSSVSFSVSRQIREYFSNRSESDRHLSIDEEEQHAFMRTLKKAIKEALSHPMNGADDVKSMFELAQIYTKDDVSALYKTYSIDCELNKAFSTLRSTLTNLAEFDIPAVRSDYTGSPAGQLEQNLTTAIESRRERAPIYFPEIRKDCVLVYCLAHAMNSVKPSESIIEGESPHSGKLNITQYSTRLSESFESVFSKLPEKVKESVEEKHGFLFLADLHQPPTAGSSRRH